MSAVVRLIKKLVSSSLCGDRFTGEKVAGTHLVLPSGVLSCHETGREGGGGGAVVFVEAYAQPPEAQQGWAAGPGWVLARHLRLANSVHFTQHSALPCFPFPNKLPHRRYVVESVCSWPNFHADMAGDH